MARRLPSQPPVLPGFSYVRVLGSGGFADVFLYEQNMPRRQVAVKVMLSEVATPQVRQMFQAEANLMAQLSTHPSILTVYQASVSADGRPYLVMELCSASIGQRYRQQPLGVPEVLSIGIRVASAVETAHRSGVLHRDIKPSNILTTAYGHPVLSDFGIASTLGDVELDEAAGLSIPWSAPEVLLDNTPGTVASEVWSLGASLYSLLAGRSPFEVPGKNNTPADLIGRITKARPAPIGRDDVPPRLEAMLARAMSKKPEARQRSALEFIRELQSIETELGLAQTPIEVAMDDWALATVADPEDRTRIKGIVSVDPGGPRRRTRKPRPQQTARPLGRSASRESAGSIVSASRSAEIAGRRTKTLAWSLVACAALVVALGVTATVVLVRSSTVADIPTVRDISANVADGTIVFSWPDPGLLPDDAYQVRVGDTPPSIQRGTQFRVDPSESGPVCITVAVNRDGRTGPSSAQKCATTADDS
ncbi:protein kinase [Microbacterium sp. STN6]|uniref:serine/threonine-protein kinase n=1 Tax=Microbacterium sp. STN6 TaxID=2995588 RepID=UPI002260B87A|nr:serine/threonine-protein kinase [Microbacterium sp. STN6]MCX7521189.1 protein kinase [Microbacterium sp. STN6]